MLNIGNYIIGGSSSSHLSNCSWNWMQPKCLPAGDVSLSIFKTVVQHKIFSPKDGIWIHKSKFRIWLEVDRHSIHFYPTWNPVSAKHSSLKKVNFPFDWKRTFRSHDPRCHQNLTMKSPVYKTTHLHPMPILVRPPRGWKTDIFRRKPIISILTHLLKFSSIESQSSIRC